MSLLFIDGFDHYATADITKKWSSVNGSPTIGSSAGRRGGGGLNMPNSAGVFANVTKTFAAESSFVMGFSIKASALATISAYPLVRLMDVGVAQCELRINVDGTLSVTRNGTVLSGGTSSNSITSSTDYYIEWKVTISDSIAADSCKVRVNGVDWINVTAGQDIKNSTGSTANQISLGNNTNSGGTFTLTYDDFYLCNQSGSSNNNFLGDVRVDTVYPNADGTYSQFTPSTAGAHYTLVDEAAPNTTDYVDGLTVGDRDSYAFGNLTTLSSQVVYGVQVNAAAMKDDAGTKSVATFARSGGTNGDGASAALGTSQVFISQVFETNPNGDVPWTQTTVDAAEFGTKVTA